MLPTSNMKNMEKMRSALCHLGWPCGLKDTPSLGKCCMPMVIGHQHSAEGPLSDEASSDLGPP